MYYVPQSIAVHSLQERQNFRRGNCSAYDNPVLRVAPNFIFPTIMIKRLTSGETPTVKLYRLTDVFLATLTTPGSDNWPLDDVGEYEMLVIEGGNWTGFVPSNIIGTQCYLKIETASADYYTDEFLIMDGTGGFPPDCGENWAKLTMVFDGTCMVSGKTTENEAEPVHSFAQTNISQILYLNANLSRPEWEYDEQGEEDAHGVVIQDTKKMVKRWTLEGLPVTESIYDLLALSALADLVSIEFADGIVFYGIRDIRTEVSWENGGCLANVKLKFSTDYFVKQGCCT